MTRQPSAASALALCAATSAGARTTFRVMSLNIRGGGAQEAKGIAQAADDHPGRIDFVWARRAGPRVTDAAIVGEDGAAQRHHGHALAVRPPRRGGRGKGLTPSSGAPPGLLTGC